MNKEFIPYEQALVLKELGFDEPCLAHLIGFGDGTIENDRYKINQQQVFYPNDYTTSYDKAEELGLYPFVICRVPLYQQAFRWFRDKYDLIGLVEGGYDNGENVFTYVIWDKFKDNSIDVYYQTYEEAELACLKKLIEIELLKQPKL
jgi:hypothetical protein